MWQHDNFQIEASGALLPLRLEALRRDADRFSLGTDDLTPGRTCVDSIAVEFLVPGSPYTLPVSSSRGPLIRTYQY